MATIVTSVGSPGTTSGASGGRTLAFNNISITPAQVIGNNPARQKITFYNPGLVDIYVAQTVTQNTGSDAPLVPSPSALGGCFLIYSNGGCMSITGECQKPWQAFSATGASNPLTVIESNV